jgi:hypothetical protein
VCFYERKYGVQQEAVYQCCVPQNKSVVFTETEEVRVYYMIEKSNSVDYHL